MVCPLVMDYWQVERRRSIDGFLLGNWQVMSSGRPPMALQRQTVPSPSGLTPGGERGLVLGPGMTDRYWP